jgi:large subunit ribosomal protein L10
MKKEQKNEIIEKITTQFKNNKNFYLSDVSTLTVNQTNELRKLCYKYGITLSIAKNTFIKKALEKADIVDESIFSSLHGPSSIMFCESLNAPAKLIKEFRRNYSRPILKAAYVEQTVYLGEESLNTLLTLKTREELIADVVALLGSPIRNLISALKSADGSIMGVLKTLSNKENN